MAMLSTFKLVKFLCWSTLSWEKNLYFFNGKYIYILIFSLFLNQKQYHSGQKISLFQKDTKSSLVNEWFDFFLYGLMIIVPNFLENLVRDKTFKLVYSN